jgi:DNA-binding MarR family transcriptional regulator
MPTSRAEIVHLVQQLRLLTAGATPENWAGLELTFMQLRALFVLRRRQPLRVGDFGDALGMSLASASALTDRLARLGYVERDRDEADRRTVLLRLSAHGERLLAEQERRSTVRLRRALSQMTPQERAAVAAALRAFLRVGALQRPAASRELAEARA